MQKMKGVLTEAKDPEGEVRYTRNDIIGLSSVLGNFDTRIHTLKDMKLWNKLRDKTTQAYYNDTEELELSVDDAAFLLTYLREVKDKDCKEKPLNEFEIKTIIGILEQLEDTEEPTKVVEEKLDKK